jgi:hypothetical protein
LNIRQIWNLFNIDEKGSIGLAGFEGKHIQETPTLSPL